MNSRERVKTALDHKEADKVPIDFGAMRSTGISAIAYNKLKEYLNIQSGQTRVFDLFQQLAEPENEILSLLGADVLQLHKMEASFGIHMLAWKDGLLPDGSPCQYPVDFNPVKNEKGGLEIYNGDRLVAVMPEGGIYFDYVMHPLESVSNADDLNKFNLPAMGEEEIEFLKTNAKRLYETTDKAILGRFGGSIFEAGQILWGYEKFFVNLMLEKKLMHHFFETLTQQYLKDLEKYLKAVGDFIDVIQFGDDLGSQQNLQISIDLYREMIKPYHKQLFQFVRKNYPHIKVFLHSCGSIYDAIPDLIDAGVEILNPVQLSAAKMDPKTLKEEFGKDLVFWGGGVDTQTTLTFKSIEEIKDEVKRNIEIFAPGGGYVFTQVHNIQANVEPEKIMAVYDTANAYRAYPIKIDW